MRGGGEGSPFAEGHVCVVGNRLFVFIFRAAIRCPFLSLSLSISWAPIRPAILVPRTFSFCLGRVALLAWDVRLGACSMERGRKLVCASRFVCPKVAVCCLLSWKDVRCFFFFERHACCQKMLLCVLPRRSVFLRFCFGCGGTEKRRVKGGTGRQSAASAVRSTVRMWGCPKATTRIVLRLLVLAVIKALR